MTKQIEDYPLPQNLEDWLNMWNTIPKTSARAQFVEMQQQIDSLTEQNKELQEQINFKIDECITLAKACNRWKENALNKESK